MTNFESFVHLVSVHIPTLEQDVVVNFDSVTNSSIIKLSNSEALHFRFLHPEDVGKLSDFLQNLSPSTRRLSYFESYDVAEAERLCDAIGKYDKLRFVLVSSKNKRIEGLIELSYGLPADDIKRYAQSGNPLKPGEDVRFGITLSDAYQSQGVGSKVFPLILKVAKSSGMKRIILWGGVLADNTQAINYYKKYGFYETGRFMNSDFVECIDMALDI